MPPTNRDTPAHRAINIAGWVFVVVGILGLIFWPSVMILWVFLIAFGVAALPRALIERWRSGR
jgi:cyanate permease